MKACVNWFFAWIFPWVPKRLLSRATGVLMRVPLPWPLSAVLIPIFAKMFAIRVDWAERAPGDYRSFDDFFTRKLKSGLRPVKGEFVHPCDSVLSQSGPVRAGELIQAKGKTYSLSEFLGDPELAKVYEGGHFATYYLCPSDYHRVHSPRTGAMVSARHIPGLLWPVNVWSVNNIQRLFNLNERVVLNFQSPEGAFTVVFVGATNVGHMTITADPSIVTNRWMWHAPTERAYSPPVPVKVGEELGMFHLGSTAVCLFERHLPGVATPAPSAVTMGSSAV